MNRAERWQGYLGQTPAPPDFEAYWRGRRETADRAPLEYTITPVRFGNRYARYMELRFRALDGAEIYVKYVRPDTDAAVPAVFHFHDLRRRGEGWFRLTQYAALGHAVLAMECRGQGPEGTGGLSAGPTACGPLVQGMDGGPDAMYYTHVYLDAYLLYRIACGLPGIDAGQVTVYGKGQGGGIAIALAALAPGIQKCMAYNPFPADPKGAWQQGCATEYYEPLNYYFRWFDPLHRREEQIFSTLGYVCGENFAPRIRAELLLGTGLQDTLCPPCTQFAVFNQAGGVKYHAVLPEFDHDFIFTYETLSLKFLAKPVGEPFSLEVLPE